MLLQEPAYLLLADVNLGGRSLAAGSVGSQEGFGSMFQPLMEAGVLHQFDPEDIWPDSNVANAVEIRPSPVSEARSILRLLEEGNALNRDQLARHARRLLFSLESLSTGVDAPEGRSKSLRDAPSMN